MLTVIQVSREFWLKVCKLAQLYNEANVSKTKELYDAANDAANAFKIEMQSFRVEDWKAFPGGHTRQDDINIEILHRIQTFVQLIATNVSLDKNCFWSCC